VIGAAIEKEIYVQVICDGVHIHPSVIKMLYKTFGTSRMILISDALSATGVKDGEYISGGLAVTVKDGVARLADGTIAGSTSTLFDCVKKAVSFGIPLEDAICMASRTPAEYLGISKGQLAVGFDADFIVLNEKLNIDKVVIGGELYFGKQ
jgi:N-acetylglucosamine-6-phosphate deacetylase